jgi:hypothetical protein
MNAETTLNRVMIALGLKNQDEMHKVELEQKKTEDGQAIFDAEKFEVGSPIFVVTQDGNIPAPMGEYVMEDGLVVSVDDKGYIAEISTKEEEIAPEEETAMQNDPMKEETGKPVASESSMEAKPKKMTETTSKIMEYSSDKLVEFEKSLEAMKMQLSALSQENEELKNRLATEEAPRTFHSPEAKVEKLQFKIGERRQESVTDRVFNQLFN